MREDEEFAKAQFDEYLKQQDFVQTVFWRAGDDPPDYVLVVNGIEYVVDVTTLDERISLGELQNVPRRTLDSSREIFIAGVEKKAKAHGILSGVYYVGLAPFEMSMDFPQQRKLIEKQLLDYIERTRLQESAPKLDIQIGDNGYCSIFKTSRSGTRLSVRIWPASAEWEGVAEAKACEYLDRIISTKLHKLSAFQLPKILLILDQYHFVDLHFYSECKPKLTRLEDFHAIFMVGGRSGYMLHCISDF